jgi:hypothetical protein
MEDKKRLLSGDSIKQTAYGGADELVNIDYIATKPMTSQYEADFRLVQAAQRGSLKAVRNILKKGADVRYCDDAALQDAASLNYASVVRELLHAGSNVRARDNHALRQAASHDCRETLRELRTAYKKAFANEQRELLAVVRAFRAQKSAFFATLENLIEGHAVANSAELVDALIGLAGTKDAGIDARSRPNRQQALKARQLLPD